MAENSREEMKPEEKGTDAATGKPKPTEDEMSKTQEDAAKEREDKGGYQ
jgi:hypothetical protein